MKQCTICKQTKPIGEFRKYSRNRDGLDTQCKACRVAAAQANKTKIANMRSSRKQWASGTFRGLNLGAGDY